MAGRHKGHFSDRRAVIECDGKLFSGAVQVSAGYYHGDGSFGLDEETREALDLTEHARLRKCAKCGARFIAHHATKLCSPECRASAKADTSRKMTAKRSNIEIGDAENSRQSAGNAAMRSAERRERRGSIVRARVGRKR